MAYNTDKDMQRYRPNILNLGVETWEDQREEAADIINRAIDMRWYRKVAREFGHDYRETPFNPDLVVGGLTRLGAFKSLELAYMRLKKDGQDDGYAKLEKEFRKLYGEELELVLTSGIDYDWDGSGDVDWTEQNVTSSRRQMRC